MNQAEAPCPGRDTGRTSLDHSLDSRLSLSAERYVEQHGLPALSVGVVIDSHLAWTHHSGWADVHRRIPPSSITRYAIASITKTFTASAVMQLHDAGLLDVNDLVAAYVPELNWSSQAGVREIRLRDVLAHQSGLMRDPPGTDWATGRYRDEAETLRRIDELAVRVLPNTRTKYSNLGYQLLGMVVARVSGLALFDYLKSMILDPLGLDGTCDDVGCLDPGQIAQGYAHPRAGNGFKPAQLVPALGGHTGLWSNMADLAKWVSFQLAAPHELARSGVLQASSVVEMQRPRYVASDDLTKAIGIGWFSFRTEHGCWVGHDGGVPGFSSSICFQPRRGVGVITLTNSIADVREFALEIGDLICARIPSPSPRPTRTAPSDADGYPGLYVMPEWGVSYRVVSDNDDLLLETPGGLIADRLSLGASIDAFVIAGGERAGDIVQFLRSGQGTITGLRLESSTLMRSLRETDDEVLRREPEED